MAGGGAALARCGLLARMAWLNLFNHRAKNIALGSLMAFGTLLVVVGGSTLDSVDAAMTRSVTGSIAGQLQVYDRAAKDPLALFGGGFMGAPDIGSMPDFSRVKDVLMAVENVRAVVPMGIDFAEFFGQTELDAAIESLRKALAAHDGPQLERVEAKLRAMASLLAAEYDARRGVARDVADIDQKRADIAAVLDDAFWESLMLDPDGGTTFLDTRIAPLADEYGAPGINYIGTDLDAFAANFDRFRMVQGRPVPPGAHGLLINQHFYDEVLRNKVARTFEELARALHDERRTIADDPLLQNKVKQMVRQYRRVTFELEPADADALEAELRAQMPGQGGNLDALVQAFLDVDDATFDARHTFFREHVAPRIDLYPFAIGDVITLRAFTRAGYPKAINLELYGTFTFSGLEESALAGAYSLIDIVSFRELYGVTGPAERAELAAIQARADLADVRAEDAEAELFGGAAGAGVTAPEPTPAMGPGDLAAVHVERAAAGGAERFDQHTIDHGLALNAAVLLADPQRIEETRARIERAIAGAGLSLTVVDWREATGMVGQFVSLAGILLVVATTIIFLVAIVIMNNTMVMATSERATEIGTLRAIGGRRAHVLGLFLLETLFLGALAGLFGAAAGFGVMSWLGHSGIPAPSDELVFLFSGPRLFPEVGAGHVLLAFVLILGVSLVATLYPAFLATRIQPVVAMQARE